MNEKEEITWREIICNIFIIYNISRYAGDLIAYSQSLNQPTSFRLLLLEGFRKRVFHMTQTDNHFEHF